MGTPIVVRTIPASWITVYYGGVPYYYCDGVYYVKTEVKDEYTPVQPPVGAIVPSLPEGAIVKTIDGKVYYEYEKVLYKMVTIENDVKYEVVSINN
ncbi:DUF6515 family protein [Psychroflexus sp. MBR-150]